MKPKTKDLLEILEEGDIILLDQEVTSNFTTWMIPFIKFFQNIETLWGLWKPFFKYHHVAIVTELNGDLVLFESLLRNQYSPIDKLHKAKGYMVLRSRFWIDPVTLKEETLKLNQRPYDFVGAMAIQLIRYLTLGIVSIPRFRDNKRFYCSELASYLMNVSSDIKYFTSYDDSPLDIYKYHKRGFYKKILEATNKK